jgi:hypothetical protein
VLTLLGGAEVKRMEAAVEKHFGHHRHQEKSFAHRQARPAQKATTNLGRAAKKVHASMTTA